MNRWLVLTLPLIGCAGLIGVPDLSYDENASQGHGPEGGTPAPVADGSSDAQDGQASGVDGGLDDGSTPACDESKVASDSDNCGRCGHSCMGGTCAAGKCRSVVLKRGLAGGSNVVFDASYIYFTTSVNGSVARVTKDGATADLLSTNQKKTFGLAIDGQSLYWSNFDNDGDGTGGSYGGVWGCSLPACSDGHRITNGNWVSSVKVFGGTLYFAEFNANVVGSVLPNGQSRTVLTSPTTPFSVAVDQDDVYYESSGSFGRVPRTGSNSEGVGPLPAGSLMGHTAIDDTRVYWAYSASTADATGSVYSALKATPSSGRIEYGHTNKGSFGVAVDDTNLYWANQGTSDDATHAFHQDGAVLTCPKAGCPASGPTVLESGIFSPRALAVDGDVIYFVTVGSKTDDSVVDGELRRIVKP